MSKFCRIPVKYLTIGLIVNSGLYLRERELFVSRENNLSVTEKNTFVMLTSWNDDTCPSQLTH